MKTLMLLRHAKSSFKDESLADHDRPLNKRGKKAAPTMGHLIKDESLVPDLIVSSTAKRARTTAEAVAKACRYPNAIELTEDLYLATAGEILIAAQSRPEDSATRVMLVAHNPGMEDLVGALSGRLAPFPTAALAVFELAIASWRDLELGVPATLVHLFRPRELE